MTLVLIEPTPDENPPLAIGGPLKVGPLDRPGGGGSAQTKATKTKTSKNGPHQNSSFQGSGLSTRLGSAGKICRFF